jgi:RNA polymerase sigma factor (sigma-70 family)
MPLNPLSVFYSVPRWELSPSGYIQISWRCDPEAIRLLARAGNMKITGVPYGDLPAVNAYFDRLLLTDSQLTNTVVENLYRLATDDANPIGHNCWFNFITAMTFRAALHTWQRVPKPQQSEELFERLTTPILNLRQLFDRFDPKYRPNLLEGLQAWTYQVVAYNSFGYLRQHGDPYFGLSNLGVVSRSSWLTIRKAPLGNMAPDWVDTYLIVCKVFKTYLERSGIRVNNLEPHHWQEILVEISSKSILPRSDSLRSGNPTMEASQRRIDLEVSSRLCASRQDRRCAKELTVDELRSQIDRIGGWIRAQANPIVEKYDDPSLFISIEGQTDRSEPDFADSVTHLSQIFATIEQFIGSLPPHTRQLVELRHQSQLNQLTIANMMSIDQSQVSRQLGKTYLNLLDVIHSQIPHPDGIKVQKNSLAIATVRHLIGKYFQQNTSKLVT